MFLALSVIEIESIAQQNLFNVPSSDITVKGKIFFQQQFNISDGILISNSTFSYGLGKEAEIGINVIGLGVNVGSGNSFFLTHSNINQSPVYPFYTVNAQKAFQLSEKVKLTIGTQTGLSAGLHFGSYSYSNAVFTVPKWRTKLIIGIYGSTDSFFGPQERNVFFKGLEGIGFQVGVEQPILEDKLFLIVENISGRHSLAESTIGGAWRFTKNWVMSVGYQFSNPNSQTIDEWVLEFTYLPRIGKD